MLKEFNDAAPKIVEHVWDMNSGEIFYSAFPDGKTTFCYMLANDLKNLGYNVRIMTNDSSVAKILYESNYIVLLNKDIDITHSVDDHELDKYDFLIMDIDTRVDFKHQYFLDKNLDIRIVVLHD